MVVMMMIHQIFINHILITLHYGRSRPGVSSVVVVPLRNGQW